MHALEANKQKNIMFDCLTWAYKLNDIESLYRNAIVTLIIGAKMTVLGMRCD